MLQGVGCHQAPAHSAWDPCSRPSGWGQRSGRPPEHKACALLRWHTQGAIISSAARPVFRLRNGPREVTAQCCWCQSCARNPATPPQSRARRAPAPSHEGVGVFLGTMEHLGTCPPRDTSTRPLSLLLPSHIAAFVPSRRRHPPGTEGARAAFGSYSLGAFPVLDPAGRWGRGGEEGGRVALSLGTGWREKGPPGQGGKGAGG